jgi:peptidyl-prolyl cis-trans isomerase C
MKPHRSFFRTQLVLMAAVVAAVSLIMPTAKAQSARTKPATASAAPATTQAADNPLLRPFVTVNGQVRNNAQAELLLREQLQRGAANSPQLQAAVRDLLVNQTLMAQAALGAGLDKLPLVQAQVELARQNTLAQAWQETVLGEKPVTDADLKAEFERQVAALGPEEFQVRHLLVAEEATAKLLIDRIKAGAAIADLATEFSRDDATKAQGGLSGWAPQGELLPGLLEAVRGLSKGQLADAPVYTPRGWHVVQLEDRRAYRAPDINQVRPQLVQAIAQQRIAQKLAELRQLAKVE